MIVDAVPEYSGTVIVAMSPDSDAVIPAPAKFRVFADPTTDPSSLILRETFVAATPTNPDPSPLNDVAVIIPEIFWLPLWITFAVISTILLNASKIKFPD